MTITVSHVATQKQNKKKKSHQKQTIIIRKQKDKNDKLHTNNQPTQTKNNTTYNIIITMNEHKHE